MNEFGGLVLIGNATYCVFYSKARQGKFIYIAHFIHSGNSKCFT